MAQLKDTTVNGTLTIGSSPVADFVIEQGTSGVWSYRKWNSGIAECWYRFAPDDKSATSSYWHFSGTYPFTFTTPLADSIGRINWRYERHSKICKRIYNRF